MVPKFQTGYRSIQNSSSQRIQEAKTPIDRYPALPQKELNQL